MYDGMEEKKFMFMLQYSYTIHIIQRRLLEPNRFIQP